MTKESSLNVAYVGDLLNHGLSIPSFGSAIIYLLSRSNKVDNIDAFCPVLNGNETYRVPSNVNIQELYNQESTFTYLRLFKIKWSKYDLIIVNMHPTSFGIGSVQNGMGLIFPLFLKLLQTSKVKVIYHNSAFTNDIKSLGYVGLFNKVRAWLLKVLEKEIFKNLDTYVLLGIYKKRLNKKIKNNKIHILQFNQIEAVPTIFLNKLEQTKSISLSFNNPPNILLVGNWGPQKNLKLALSSLEKIKKMGYNFNLIIGGQINKNFKDFKEEYEGLLERFSGIITENRGYIAEIDMNDLFSRSDILLLPYNAPGGHSGVLAMGLFFNCAVVSIDFP